MPNPSAEVRVSKSGPGGRPYAEILVEKNIGVDALNKVILKVTRSKDLLRKVGLKACPACKSGLDIFVRDRFAHVMQVNA